MSAWNPSHVQFTVLRARNLISKGKSGSNDVFVTIQLGKEKYQTSTIKNAQNPEWFEECDLPIPHMHSEIEVQLFHRGILSDDFLGYTTIPLWEQKIQDKAKSQWIHLKNKPSRGPDNKPRGEIEVKVTFHSHSRVDFSSGLKKRSSSLRNLATAFGDRLKLTRSKSFRENRKDPEGGKPDKHLNQNHGSLNDIPERKPHMQKGIITSGQRKPPVTPLPTVSFPALDVNHSWVDAAEEGLTRSYSMSAAYVKTMSLDRGGILSLTSSADQPDISQSAFNVAGNRRSMVELPSSQAPPPYHVRPSSQDDMILVQREGGQHAQSRRPLSANANYLDSVLRRERIRCESIRERTEPEESSSTDEERTLRRPRPRKPRSRSSLQEPVTQVAEEMPAMRHPASFSSHLTSTPVCLESDERILVESQRPETITNGSFQYDRSNIGSLGRRVKPSNTLGYPNGEVTMRKRSKRDRLKLYRQAGRCITVQGFEGRFGGLYDDSLSDPSDSSRTDIPDDTLAVYKTMNKEDLLRVVIQNKAQLIRKDQYIKDLENYIDDLLVRVMECTPRILHRPPMHHR